MRRPKRYSGLVSVGNYLFLRNVLFQHCSPSFRLPDVEWQRHRRHYMILWIGSRWQEKDATNKRSCVIHMKDCFLFKKRTIEKTRKNNSFLFFLCEIVTTKQSLIFSMSGITGERDCISDVVKTSAKEDQAFKTKTKSLGKKGTG